MLRYLFVFIFSCSLTVTSWASDSTKVCCKPQKVVTVDKELLLSLKVDNVWHEGKIMEVTDSSVLYKMNIVVYKKIDTTDADGSKKRKYEAVTKDTVVTILINKITNVSVYKTIKRGAIKRRKILMWTVSVASIILAPVAGPYAFMPIVVSGIFISVKYINPVKRINLKKRKLVFE